jgi:NADH:ubiquinone oxidoreductase subunit F (NADH-binding)
MFGNSPRSKAAAPARPCRIGSGRGAALAERVVAGDLAALAEQQPLLATLETASMCAFGRGAPASIRSLLRVYADELPI